MCVCIYDCVYNVLCDPGDSIVIICSLLHSTAHHPPVKIWTLNLYMYFIYLTLIADDACGL